MKYNYYVVFLIKLSAYTTSQKYGSLVCMLIFIFRVWCFQYRETWVKKVMSVHVMCKSTWHNESSNACTLLSFPKFSRKQPNTHAKENFRIQMCMKIHISSYTRSILCAYIFVCISQTKWSQYMENMMSGGFIIAMHRSESDVGGMPWLRTIQI